MRMLMMAAVAAGFIGAPARAADNATPPPATDAQGEGSLSEKLSNTGGVIHPKTDIDPSINTAPPAAEGRMPVIPPPGTPGGDPSVQPK